MKKIIIIGSRTRDDDETYHLILNEFKKHYEQGDIIVSGGCKKGGDIDCSKNGDGTTENQRIWL